MANMTRIYNCLSYLCFVITCDCPTTLIDSWDVVFISSHFICDLCSLFHIINCSDIPESYLCLGLGIYSWWFLWLFCDSFLKTFTATSHACSDLLQCCKILRSRVSFFHFHNIVVFMRFYWWPCCPPSTWRAGRLTFIWTLTIGCSHCQCRDQSSYNSPDIVVFTLLVLWPEFLQFSWHSGVHAFSVVTRVLTILLT